MDTLTKGEVWWRELMPVLLPHLQRWSPPSRPTAAAYADLLADYLRHSVPGDSSVDRYLEVGDATAMLRLAWQGVLFTVEAWIEVVDSLQNRDEYDRVVGRLEQLGVHERRFIVVVVRDRKQALVERLARRYKDRGSKFAVICVETAAGSPVGVGSLAETQVSPDLKAIVSAEIELYERGTEVSPLDHFPATSEIPFQDARLWIRVESPICVFLDMRGSTAMSASDDDKNTAAAYRLFTTTMVKILHRLDADYIDVQGDGAFGLFAESKPHAALAAAITANTFAREVFTPLVFRRAGLTVGSHVGIDRKTLLVRKIGLRRDRDRTDRQNEVWAGRTVNMAAKLAALADDGEILASDRFHAALRVEAGKWRCECDPHPSTWIPRSVSGNTSFDFEEARSLAKIWCPLHGRELCDALARLDSADA